MKGQDDVSYMCVNCRHAPTQGADSVAVAPYANSILRKVSNKLVNRQSSIGSMKDVLGSVALPSSKGSEALVGIFLSLNFTFIPF